MTAQQPKVAKISRLPTGLRQMARAPLAATVAYLLGGAIWLFAFGETDRPSDAVHSFPPFGTLPAWGLLLASAALLHRLLRTLGLLDRKIASDISAHDLTDIVAVIDADGCLLRWNAQAEALAGFAPAWQGGRLLDAVPAEDQPVFQAGLNTVRATGRAEFECRLRSAQETALPCLWAASALRDGSGAIVVSARIAAEQDRPAQHLAERERRFRYMVEMAPHLIAVVAGGRIAFINETGSRLLGEAGPALLSGKIWSNFHPPATREGECLRRTDGALLNVELSEVPILWDEQIASLYEARDITDLVRADQARRRSEELLKGIVDNAVDAVITADDDSVIQSFNPSAERIFGWKAEEIIGQRIEKLMPEPMRGSHAAIMQHYMRSGESKAVGFGRELTALRKDGHPFPVELALSDLRLGDRRLFTSVIRDITERKRSEERLVIAEKVLESTSEGVMVTNMRGTIVWVNNAFCTISGYGKDEVIGENASLLKSGLQGPDFYRTMWSCIYEKGQWSGEIWNRRKDGEAYPEWLTIRAIPAEDGGKSDKFVGVFSDISKHKRAEETIKTLTYYDAVTRLPNRYLFQDRLTQALERAHRSGRLVALVLVGLDRFRTVNETLGHQTGDAMLREVADRLLTSVRGEDTVARLRGDTFCCVLSDLTLATDAHPVITRIMDAFTGSFILGGHELFITASLGISLYPLDGLDTDDLIQKAETAMNRSKEKAENTYHFYTPEMNANSMERLRLETDLRKAIGRNELMLYYQPKVETTTGRIVGAEALMRWRHQELGLVSPGQFIPIAEDTGLIVPIGIWALHAACEQIRAWQNAGVPVVRIAVNLSALQFRQPNLVEAITHVLEQNEVDPSLIELELTESAIMQNADVTIQTLNQLHEKGFRLSIDDFGTGYSSLSYLKRFPIDKLKIDRSFVQDLGSNSAGEEIVGAIIAMAHSLTLSVIAEGVETDIQLSLLKQMKCDEIQGFYFSKPVPADQFEAYLRQGVMRGESGGVRVTG